MEEIKVPSREEIKVPSREEILEAAKRVEPFVHKTPVLNSSLLNSIAGCDLHFKCENFQKVGAFKYRGATNSVLQLTTEERSKGVATHSSGNHAQALALAAKSNDVQAHIVMPTNAPKVKSNAVKDYGAEIIWCEPTLEARESKLAEVITETGATMVHPYDNHNVICGQSTVAQELLDQVVDLDIIITPIGGGGLLSGTLLATKYLNPKTLVYGAEPEQASDAYESFKASKLIPVKNPDTIADGLRTSLSPRTFSIISENVQDILLVSEKEILDSMHLLWERLKIIVEPSSAVPLAAILRNRELFRNKKVGVILSGGNVDLKKFSF